jgi:hypothetical protein
MTERKALLKLKDVAKRMPDTFLSCRDHGHLWAPLEAAWLQDGNIERTLGCTRCEAKRLQYLDKNGYVLGGHYNYADGYAMKGIGRLDTDGRAVLRRASVLKQLG